jgi:isocitrate dehydrogenase kinase/phosphatase
MKQRGDLREGRNMTTKDRDEAKQELFRAFDRVEYLYEKTGFYDYALEKQRINNEILRLYRRHIDE